MSLYSISKAPVDRRVFSKVLDKKKLIKHAYNL